MSNNDNTSYCKCGLVWNKKCCFMSISGGYAYEMPNDMELDILFKDMTPQERIQFTQTKLKKVRLSQLHSLDTPQ